MRMIVAGALLAAALAAAPAAAQQPVRFVAYGDTQDETPQGRARERTLVARINALAPDFVVHVGDLKGGGPCSDEAFAEIEGILALHERPLVVTPGDNDWTDCHLFGRHDPLERLDALRAWLFPPGESLGAERMALSRQEQPFVENARWEIDGVVFVTIHMVGSNNNLRPDAAAAAEFFARDAANLAWLDAAFDAAGEAGTLVVFFQANPDWNNPPWTPRGTDAVRERLVARAASFGGHVLAVHGDTHTARIDQPARVRGRTVGNLVRLEVFGPPDLGAVEVVVDARADPPFSFRPIVAGE